MLMNFLMTAAPLAMHLCGHSQESANLGLQWHVIAMYAPSFFTGALITRFGAGRVATVGLALTGLAAAVGLGGVDVAHFWGRSEEHTSELQSLMRISYAVFGLKKKNTATMHNMSD